MTLNANRISAATLVRLHQLAASQPLSRAYGEALAQALREASEPAKPASLKPGQPVTVGGQVKARILSIASNGVWILRAATDGEYLRTGLDQIRERISIRQITPA